MTSEDVKMWCSSTGNICVTTYIQATYVAQNVFSLSPDISSVAYGSTNEKVVNNR